MRRLQRVLKRWLVVLEATTYARIYVWAAATGEVLVCSREPTNVEIKLYSHKNIFVCFLCMYMYENIFTKRITV